MNQSPMKKQPLTTRRTFLQSAGLAVSSTLLMPAIVSAQNDTDYELIAQTGTAPITNGRTDPTAIWGYNGRVPGPLLRVRQGDTLNARLVNRLDQPTSIHWHGIRIDNRMDGSPLVQEPVAPGDHFDYSFVAPDAGTYWYHTHTRGYEQMTRGLYGMLIVDESTPPTDHYDNELQLVFDDWRLDDKGQIEEDSIGAMMHRSHAGRMGNWGSVNGTNKPDISISRGSRNRVRVINVCNARILTIAFNELDTWVIAHDGQPTTPHRLQTTLTLAPGQRTDLIIDMPADGPDRHMISVHVRDKVYEAAHFVLTDDAPSKPRTAEPRSLTDNSLHAQVFDLNKPHAVQLHMQGGAMGGMRDARYQGKVMDIRSLVKHGKAWAFNGIADMDTSETPLFETPRGRTVTITMHNDTAWPHAMHLHGHHFRVIEVDGQRVDPGPWRDTHLMQPQDNHTIALVADNPGDWLMHCHMVDHAVAGMTSWFRVT